MRQSSRIENSAVDTSEAQVRSFRRGIFAAVLGLAISTGLGRESQRLLHSNGQTSQCVSWRLEAGRCIFMKCKVPVKCRARRKLGILEAHVMTHFQSHVTIRKNQSAAEILGNQFFFALFLPRLSSSFCQLFSCEISSILSHTTFILSDPFCTFKPLSKAIRSNRTKQLFSPCAHIPDFNDDVLRQWRLRWWP